MFDFQYKQVNTQFCQKDKWSGAADVFHVL